MKKQMMKKQMTMKAIAALALAAAVAAGCSEPLQPRNDSALSDQVKSALAKEQGLKATKLEVDANSGVVVLKGRVADDKTKQRIEEVAKAVPGVTWVQSQLAVIPKAG
jgi:osmotically-inducible protein OsmY